jgi:N-acyl-D-amino-acid deacylase
MFDVILKNGHVFDGSGNPWTKLDIGVKDGKIAFLGDLSQGQATQIIDCKNMAVSPGFIDPHVHSDLLCTKPEIHKIKALQGVTTELFGQDGISVAPVSEETKPLWQKQLNGLNGDIGDWPWNSIDEYLTFLENSKMIGNAAYLVPHGAVRTLVMGFEGRTATTTEMGKMRELVYLLDLFILRTFFRIKKN